MESESEPWEAMRDREREADLPKVGPYPAAGLVRRARRPAPRLNADDLIVEEMEED